ncbi:hypothetical protein F4779DRAFT_596572 [Xylariaceae sp. FL0662B]|nr:hypothetical protein F4779DRAFT_596572 [Xylariaceae sp. FL0662B]
MEFSGMTQKWSSKPKECRTTRVRENQRRHRARTKAYIASMERQLNETRARLDEVLAENTRLTSEMETLRASSAGKSVANGPEEVVGDRPLMISLGPLVGDSDIGPPVIPPSPPLNTWSGECPPLPPLFPPKLNGAYVSLRAFTPPLPAPLQAASSANHTSTPPSEEEDSPRPATKAPGLEKSSNSRPARVCSATSCLAPTVPTTTSSRDDADLALLQSDCSHLPPPALGESTIPCAVAYLIIKQQNHNGLNLSFVEEFLAPGFRRATIQGDGCRVESSRVFSVIDVIS